ncbi:MAG: YggT family protein [Candidatus Omnitrophica bacterium]|nr:YggT family protein [Candidatus Omnitrophota bacterium]
MFILGNFIGSIGFILGVILNILKWLVIIRALISWVNPDPLNPVVQFLRRATDPILIPIRNRMPVTGGFDLSPLVALLIILFLDIFLVNTIYAVANSLGATIYFR